MYLPFHSFLGDMSTSTVSKPSNNKYWNYISWGGEHQHTPLPIFQRESILGAENTHFIEHSLDPNRILQYLRWQFCYLGSCWPHRWCWSWTVSGAGSQSGIKCWGLAQCQSLLQFPGKALHPGHLQVFCGPCGPALQVNIVPLWYDGWLLIDQYLGKGHRIWGRREQRY